jgi:hypothetical protein
VQWIEIAAYRRVLCLFVLACPYSHTTSPAGSSSYSIDLPQGRAFL